MVAATRQRMTARLWSETGSVFEQIRGLALEHDGVNLGVGTPEMDPPEELRHAVEAAMASRHNQYAPMRGEKVLRDAISQHAKRFYGQEVDPEAEVTVTSGVTEGLYAASLAFVEPGDEVIVFEPFYECYTSDIRAAGGVPVGVTLRAPGFRFDPQELRAAFSPRTKVLILNTPHNPTGTVFSLAELQLVAELCQEFDVLAITDEVYEHIVFDGAQHLRLATLPGMRDRTLTLGGAGKTFSCTGWRIGWAIGPAPLHDALDRLRQFTVFAAPTPFQSAIATGLSFPDSYFNRLAAGYQARRDFIVDTLAVCGLGRARPAGGFFVLADTSSFPWLTGREFCCELARHVGVVPVPLDTFYLDPKRGERTVRFTFCPGWGTLQEAQRRLSKLATVCRWRA